MTHEELILQRAMIIRKVNGMKVRDDFGHPSFYSCHQVQRALRPTDAYAYGCARGKLLAKFYWDNCFRDEDKKGRCIATGTESPHEFIHIRQNAIKKLIAYIKEGQVDHIIKGEIE